MSPMIYDPFIEAQNNLMTQIGNKHKLEEVQQVWFHLGQWIIDCLIAHRTVKVKRLGVFALSNWKIDTGIRKYAYFNQPTFIISEKLKNDYDLKQTKQHILEKCPVLTTNYWSISQLCSMDRKKVEECIEEVLLALGRLLYQEKDLRLIIPGLGNLEIISKQAKFDYNLEIMSKIKPLPPAKQQEICPKRDITYSPPPYQCPYIDFNTGKHWSKYS